MTLLQISFACYFLVLSLFFFKTQDDTFSPLKQGSAPPLKQSQEQEQR